jgi:transposase
VGQFEELTTAVQQEVNKRPEALRLMTHPGVGPITALAYVLMSRGSGSSTQCSEVQWSKAF